MYLLVFIILIGNINIRVFKVKVLLYLQKAKLLVNRYFIFLSYKGTDYHGWQVQPGSVTIQKLLDEALSTILSENIKTVGAGRTDTGVHASFYCAHFNSKSEKLQLEKNLIYKLNGYLPTDISIKNIRRVKNDVNARFNAISRTYKYYIIHEKDPFCVDNAWFVYGDLNIEKMNEAAAVLLNHTEFTSFSKLHSDNKTDTCHVYYARWEKSDNKLLFTITADRFLRNMVRAIVGTMVDVGKGKTDITEFENIIKASDRSRAGKSAPAKGLFLAGIEYPEDIYI
jgi:tRNA pseudouridine38-40 synthase